MGNSTGRPKPWVGDNIRSNGRRLQVPVNGDDFKRDWTKGEEITKQGESGDIVFHCTKKAPETPPREYVIKRWKKLAGNKRREMRLELLAAKAATAPGNEQYFMQLHAVYESETEVHAVFNKYKGGDLRDPQAGSLGDPASSEQTPWRTLTPEQRQRLGMRFMHQAMYAVQKLHELGIAHGDLNVTNLFLTHEPITSDACRVALIDYGKSKMHSTSAWNKKKGRSRDFVNDVSRLGEEIQLVRFGAFHEGQRFDNGRIETLLEFMQIDSEFIAEEERPPPVTMKEAIEKGQQLGLFPAYEPQPLAAYAYDERKEDPPTKFHAGYSDDSDAVEGYVSEESSDDWYLRKLRRQHEELVQENRALRDELQEIVKAVRRCRGILRV